MDFNPGRPVFTLNAAYRRTISEYFANGDTVLTVDATDSDNVCIIKSQ